MMRKDFSYLQIYKNRQNEKIAKIRHRRFCAGVGRFYHTGIFSATTRCVPRSGKFAQGGQLRDCSHLFLLRIETQSQRNERRAGKLAAAYSHSGSYVPGVSGRCAVGQGSGRWHVGFVILGWYFLPGRFAFHRIVFCGDGVHGPGNVPAAIFNASVSSLAGVFITPIWMGAVLSTATAGVNTGHAILELSVQVLLPVFLGMLLHKRFGAWALKNARWLKLYDQTVILLIVYVSFCESFAGRMFQGQTFGSLLLLSAAMLALFFAVYGLTALFSKAFRFNGPDTTAALFCGSKKSLVHGTVMAKVLFPGTASVGVILLPLMIFHTLQLIVVSMIVHRRNN